MKQIFILCCVLLLACNKDDVAGTKFSDKATVIDTGEVAVDGCGWVILSEDSTIYHPNNLPDAFKQNNLEVQVDYYKTHDSFTCGWGAKFNVINITTIKPR